MKKTFLTLMAMTCGLVGYAQTNFRTMTFDQAVEAAKAENKLVFIDVYTSWCGPCKMMARDVFPQKQVGDFMNEHFVCIKLDAEKEGEEVAKRFNVKAYPTFIIAGTDKKEVNQIVGYNQPDAFIEKVKTALNPELTPDKMKARYDKGERTPELMKAYVNYLEEQASLSYKERKQKMKEIEAIVDSYFKGLDTKARLASENIFVYKNYITKTSDEKFQFLIANKNKFAEADRKDVDDIIGKLVEGEIGGYFSGSVKYTPEEFGKLKQLVSDNNLNADKKYDAAYRFIEASATADKAKFIEFCRKNLKTLDDRQKKLLLGGFANFFADSDAAIKEKAAKYLRSLLPDLSVNTIYWTVAQIRQLEPQSDH